jgi:hypothetical protein
VALVVLCILYLRASRAHRAQPQRPLERNEWLKDAGEGLSALSESERCDLIFAVAALETEHSRAILESALDDESEGVALAAATTLVRRGHAEAVRRYFVAHRGDRASRIAETLELLG